MKKSVVSLVILGSFYMTANADRVQECMVKAKIFQNPSALAGAADVCMQEYFDGLKAEADACRVDASTKTFVDVEYAGCQGSLILGLRDQIGICKDEANGLLKENDELTARVSAGAGAGCEKLSEQVTEICRENANKFTGLARSAATTACKTAGL
jgi:hypothetical protein